MSAVSPRSAKLWSRLSLLVVALLLASLATGIDERSSVSAQDALASQISSKNWIVIDADTGEVFAQHDADVEKPIASLTKIYTTIEALSLASLDTQVLTNSSDLFDSNSTQVGFGPGETFSLEDLIYGMLLPSGNDAAHAIARVLGMQPGDTDDQAVAHFVDLENQRIKDMGLNETHLVNPHGLGVPGHYSSAHDLAAFTRYALTFSTFVKAIGTLSYTTANGYSFSNTNKLLAENSDLLGGKTGYDDTAGYCLVEVFKRNGSTMITVTFDGQAPDVWYQDNVILADYGFQQKAARISGGKPIASAITYKNPDVAIIENNATPAGSFGIPVAAPAASPSIGVTATAVPVATVAPTSTPSISPAKPHSGGGSTKKIIAALAVVALVVVASAIGSGWRPGRRGALK